MFLFGANLPEAHLVLKALPRVFGIGPHKAQKICSSLSIFPQARIQDLTPPQISSIAQMIENDPDKCGHELQRKIGQRVMHLHNIKCLRGDRLARGLPAHGQKSHRRANTAHRRCGQFVKLTPHPNFT